jgi:O-antigen/teichoic acid export membrane protein
MVWLNVEFIFLFLPESYRDGTWVILLIGLTRLTDMTFSLNNEILDTSKYFRANFVILVALIIMLYGFNLWLIPLYGMEGGGIATLLAFIIFNLIKYLFLKWKVGIGVFTWKNLFAFTLVLGFIGLDHVIRPDINLILSGILKSTLFVGLFVLICYRLKLSDDFSSMLKMGMKKIGLA